MVVFIISVVLEPKSRTEKHGRPCTVTGDIFGYRFHELA